MRFGVFKRLTIVASVVAFGLMVSGCSKCGFGFVFELLDDYYPAPNAAFFVCDRQERVIDAGKGSYELTGLTDEDVIGRLVRAFPDFPVLADYKTMDSGFRNVQRTAEQGGHVMTVCANAPDETVR